MAKEKRQVPKGRPPEAAKGLRPPKGVPVTPPDIEVSTVLDYSAPALLEVQAEGRESLNVFVDSLDKKGVEKRITLLARLIIEDTLWKCNELSPKDRISAASEAIKLFEGKNMELWQDDGDDIPQSQDAIHKELKKQIARVQGLMKESTDIQELANSAARVVKLEKAKDGEE